MADSAIQPHYDAEAAFHLYLHAAGRSYLKVAELSGVSLSTIRFWASRDRWSDQATLLEDHARRANRQHILSELDLGMPKALRTIRTLIDEGKSEKVRLDASSRWVDLWGKYRGLVEGDGVPGDAEAVDPADIPDSDLFAELKRQASG